MSTSAGEADTLESLGSLRATLEPGAESSVSRFARHQLPFEERYEVRETVSHTRLAEVRRVHDRPFARDVAMKVLRRERAKRTSLWRFFREARIQGQLDHLCVVPVHDLGVDPAGDPFFTMRWIGGRRFDHVLSVGDRGDLLRLLRDACRALAFAHARGVVHRDLKPTNLMVGDQGELYVLDWGLAKLRSDPDAIADPIQDASGAVATREGSVLGTIGYMAPEQLRGESDVDGRADIYSLGAMLYEAVCGAPLHTGSKSKAALSLLKTDGARPATRCPADTVDPEVDEIVYRATRLRPEERLSEAAEMADVLDAALERRR